MEICIICGARISEQRQRRHAKTCSEQCSIKLTQRKYHQANPQSSLSSNTSGAISEHRVIIDLLSHNFEVFHSVNPGASCDLAILKNGKLSRVEVRTRRYSSSGKPYRMTRPVKADILASVLPDKIVYDPSLE